MKKISVNPKKISQAFTLIELLVVIAIIGILAGLLLPAIARVKASTRMKVAKMEMKALETAIKAYEADYSRLPFHSTMTGESYNANNAILIAMLLPQNMVTNAALAIESGKFNPRQTQYFSAKFTLTDTTPGIGPDYVYRDPWGKPYIVALDINGDNWCEVYTGLKIPGSVAIYSYGPDLTDDHGGKEDVTSWGSK